MNSNFLAKVFSCPLFVDDYRRYMSIPIHNKETFRVHAERDNTKKIDALAKVIHKSIETKNMRVQLIITVENRYFQEIAMDTTDSQQVGGIG
jgi:hypothetical protein